MPDIRLVPPDPDQLPLGFELGEHLRGRKDAFRDEVSGKRLSGRALDSALAEFPSGAVKTITISGSYVPPGANADQLETWSQVMPVPGTLDASTLGYLAHAAAREVVGAKRKGDTAREVYTTSIVIEGPPAPKPIRARPVREVVTFKSGRQQVVYRRKNGRFGKKPGPKKSTRSKRK